MDPEVIESVELGAHALHPAVPRGGYQTRPQTFMGALVPSTFARVGLVVTADSVTLSRRWGGTLADMSDRSNRARDSIMFVEPPLTIREAKLDDAATIARLNNVVQALHFSAFPERFQEPDEARAEQVYRQMLASNGTAVTAQTRAWLCVDDHDAAVGYVLAALRERPENPFTKAIRWIELDQIAVLDDARGLGAGRLLAASVVEWAQVSGIELLELSVWDFNEGGLAFFNFLGFEPLWHRHSLRLPTP